MINKFFLFFAFFLIVTFVFSEAITDKQEKFIYDSKGKRDPFYPVAIEKPKTGVGQTVKAGLSPREKLKQKGIVVSSIVWDPKKPAILINDDILEIGDSIQGVIVRNIEQEYVVFEVDGELIEVPISA